MGLKSIGIATAVVASILVACGSDGSLFGDGDGENGGTGENGSSGGENNGGVLASGTATEEPAEELKGCATETKKATPLPLDLYIMFDTSGSMAHFVSANVSKYKAVSDALNSFATDKASEGINVGLGFFPLRAGNVPSSCTTDAQCPTGTGPCLTGFCSGVQGLMICKTKQDCPGPSNCVTAGRCSIVPDILCAGACPQEYGASTGTCNAAPGVCFAGDSCAGGDYATPAVPIAALPGNAAAIATALAGKSLEGRTPTSAALQGAIDRATTHLKANAGHTVAVVFATDGLPTACTTDINAIGNIAAAGASAGVKTFVIGVFAQSDLNAGNTPNTPQFNMDHIASKGGSSKAFMVVADATAKTQFQAALNTIRGTALPCEYNVPAPESGEPDYAKLNVQHTAPDGSKTLHGYTQSAASCDPTKGGWYYDVDPAGGAKPTKIILCPSTCNQAKSIGGQVDVVIGCKTIGPK